MNLGELTGFLYEKPLLALTIGAILAAILSGMLAPSRPGLGKVLRNGAYLGLAAALLLTVAEIASHNPRSEAAFWLDRTRPPQVEGNRTVIRMRTDGHFWVEARLNSVPVEFLVDTGATYTGVSASTARKVGLVPDTEDDGVMLDTANGPIVARMAMADSLTFGSVDAHGLPVAIAPDTESDVNVIGMNLLSLLASWRVEGDRLILEPRPAAKS
jgi:aspartyl protease family protein